MTKDIVFFSDVHLGCSFVQEKLFIDTLNKIPLNVKIIFVGDIFDFWKTSDFEKYRTLLDGRDIEYILGNHDYQFKGFGFLKDEHIHDELYLNINNRKILIIHGHIVDSKYGIPENKDLVNTDKFIDRFAKFMHINIRKLSYPLIKLYYFNISSFYENLSIVTTEKNANAIISGHSHIPFHKMINNIEVFNLGSWYNKPHILLIRNNQYAFFEIDETFDFNSQHTFEYFR